MTALLMLEDGTVFHGSSIGAPGFAVGEVVFNTAMTGYQEILTDPSYARQIVTLTYPHIGNTGVNADDVESSRVWAAGLVIRDCPATHSSWRHEQSLPDYLSVSGTVAIADLDTRRLTRLIRERGAQAGCIAAGAGASPDEALARARAFPGLAGMDLAKVVTRDEQGPWQGGAWSLEEGYADAQANPGASHVVAYDFGVKRNILRMLTDRGCRVTVVPAQTSADTVLGLEPDGIFLSNGPGDPEPCTYAIEAIRGFLDAGLPLFGICLGHQLLALACGGTTVKMPFGHHGANHPVKDLATGAVVITSQNHGFAVDGQSLPDDVEVTHVSLFDGTVQGVRAKRHAAFGFQGHPEASPGPHDCGYLFDRFVDAMA
ncbi:MAG: glutamine-hydrolyzing carbamoyl-phosphate synthase small subunit [Gammaproteobacteria bacterium]|nr:glutamine-hydrolyzing carbamoyl-phosphate synthase small subunit [Gammaproteobacteria bacterium]